MRPILSDILTFRQHLNALIDSLDLYRPPFCLHCFKSVIWFHGYYYRKPDRLNTGQDSGNDIPIPRFQCASCRHTFSTLPECIAPVRWYPWAIQQWCLWLSLNGWSVKQLNRTFPMARSTIKRWVNWLDESFKAHHITLCSQFHPWAISQRAHHSGATGWTQKTFPMPWLSSIRVAYLCHDE